MAIQFYDDVFLRHETGQHPERPARLEGIVRRLEKPDPWIKLYQRGEFALAEAAQLERVHSKEYIQTIAERAKRGGGHLDADTIVSPQSYDVARFAAGAAIEAVNQVCTGKHRRAIGLVRPPGHHALPDLAMGFCLFNNVAIAARHAQAEHALTRILIVDWDVHHGNGTQDIFYEDPNVYFFSAHRFPFYPGTGREDETGHGAGLGTTFNLPLKFGISRETYFERFRLKLEQAAEKCKPELVLISAGFDAHKDDPIGSLGLHSEDFGSLTKMVCDVAAVHCDGRVISLLEGGYNIEALAESVASHMQALVEGEAESE
jgi:acetoin utilization deacetylase AcuC-like enzyme